jgi:hypothetical protein
MARRAGGRDCVPSRWSTQPPLATSPRRWIGLRRGRATFQSSATGRGSADQRRIVQCFRDGQAPCETRPPASEELVDARGRVRADFEVWFK